MSYVPSLFKLRPDRGTEGFAIELVDGGGVDDGALDGATGHGVDIYHNMFKTLQMPEHSFLLDQSIVNED